MGAYGSMVAAAGTLLGALALSGCPGDGRSESATSRSGKGSAGEGHVVALDGNRIGLCQSPIDIRSWAAPEGHHEVRLEFGSSRQHIVNKGTTIELEYDEGSTIEFDGKVYEFRQFHFHTPSEHRIDGITYPMEMHLVHTLKGDPGRFLVAAILFKEGPQPNPFLGAFLDAVPDEAGEEVIREERVDVRQLQAARRSYYTYAGSLTTPPYSETVTWAVTREIRLASPEQIARFRELEGNNARHVQPLYGRVVEQE